jgi:hypothetical protein
MFVDLKERTFCDIEVENSAILYNDAPYSRTTV